MPAERERKSRELDEKLRKQRIENADDWDQILTDMGLMSEESRKYREIYRRKDKAGQEIMRMKKEADDEWERLSPQEKKKRLEKYRIDREIERRYK